LRCVHVVVLGRAHACFCMGARLLREQATFLPTVPFHILVSCS
jgi:hypothetical protein